MKTVYTMLYCVAVCFLGVSVVSMAADTPQPSTDRQAANQPNITQLLQQLRSTNSEEVIDALDALYWMHNVPSSVVPVLSELIKTREDEELLKVAMTVAISFDDAYRYIPAFEVCMSHPDLDVRDGAICLITRFKRKEAIDAIMRGLTNQYENIRECAQDALELLTDEEFTTPQQWHDWWRSKRASFRFPD